MAHIARDSTVVYKVLLQNIRQTGLPNQLIEFVESKKRVQARATGTDAFHVDAHLCPAFRFINNGMFSKKEKVVG